jgi:hypothetical protein
MNDFAGSLFRPFLPLRCFGSALDLIFGSAWTPKKQDTNNSIATTELSLSEDKARGVYALSRICSLVSPHLNEKGEGDFPSLFRSAPSWDLWAAISQTLRCQRCPKITALLPLLMPRARSSSLDMTILTPVVANAKSIHPAGKQYLRG